MTSPQISVIIPVFNKEKYLSQCLESVIGQTFSDMEIICVNDGSTDHSPEILTQYAAREARLCIINQKNRGLSAARNAGMDAARGTYILFIDADDWVEPDMLEKLFNSAQQTDADLACAQLHLFAETENDLPRTKSLQSYFDKFTPTADGCLPLADNPLKINVVSTGKLYKTSIIKEFELSFPKRKLTHEDEYWAWAYNIHCQSYVHLPDRLYHYRIHNNSITGSERKTARALDIIDIHLLTVKEMQRFNRLEQHLPRLEKMFNDQLTRTLIKCGVRHYAKARRKMAGYLKIPGISENFRQNITALKEAEIPFSVIVPVYNTAPWLSCCLDSLLAQTTDLFEIICVNDGSTDHSPEILAQYAAREARLRIINQKNRGLSAPRNAGMDAARGTYILFIDSDDWIEPQTIEKAFTFMQTHELDMLMFRQRNYNPETKTFSTCSYYDFPASLPGFSVHSGKEEPEMYAMLPHSIHKVRRRKLLTEHNLRFDENITQGEDEYFNLQFLPYADRFGILKQYFYNYRFPREGSIMSAPELRNKKPETIGNIFALLDGLVSIYKKQNDEKIKKALATRYIAHIGNLFRNYPVFTNHHCYISLRRQLKKNKEIFRGRRNLQPETYKQIKELVSRGWYTCRFRCLAVTAGQSAAGRIIGLGFDFIKAYLLFPWYVYKIYKTLIKK